MKNVVVTKKKEVYNKFKYYSMDVLHILEYIYGDERKYIRNKGQTSYSYTYIYTKPTIT